MKIVTTKKKRVDPNLLRKWVYKKSGKWIQKELTRKSQFIYPNLQNCVYENGWKEWLTESTLSQISLFWIRTRFT